MATLEMVAGRAQARRRTSARMRRRTITFYLFISPWLLGFIFLSVLPLLLGLLTSLTNYDGLNLSSLKFVGLDNYAKMLSDPDFGFSMGRTVMWAALNLPIWICLSFLLALLLNQDVRGRGLFRTLYYMPYVIPAVAMVWIWKIFLDKNYGLLNAVLSVFRPGTAIPWLSEHALVGLTAIAVFSGLGWAMVIFLAGLQDIPDELVEAARIDGANGWQVFRHVTLPLMTPVIFFVLLNGLISSFQQFIFPLLLGTGTSQLSYPPRDAYFYMLHTYRQLFVYQRFGYGIALLWVLFVIIMAFTLLLFRTERYWVHTEGGGQEELR
jgi:multiple sugar transport system permease protein